MAKDSDRPKSTSNPRERDENGGQAVIAEAVRRVFRPLVKLLLNKGLTYPSTANLLKELFVEVADQEFPVEGKRQTDSRISILTGVHRKDVRRLRAEHTSVPAPPTSISMGSQVVARWVADRRYADGSGVPKALPLRATRGPSFEELVTSVSRQDVRPRAVLDELVRLQIVELSDGEHVRLRVNAFVPSEGLEEQAFYFGRNLADHAAAAGENLSGAERPWLERSVSYHELSSSDVETLREMAEELGMEALKSLNRRALAMQRRNRRKVEQGAEACRTRMSFGVYFYGKDEDARETES